MPPDRPVPFAAFGRNLRAARLARGWSQHRAATIERSERGRPVSLDTAVRLAGAYGTTLDALLGWAGGRT